MIDHLQLLPHGTNRFSARILLPASFNAQTYENGLGIQKRRL